MGLRIVSTLHVPSRVFLERVELLERAGQRPATFLRRLLRATRGCDAVILNGSIGRQGRYVDLVAAAALGRRREAPAVVLADCTWKPGPGPVRLARRAAIRLLDRPRLIYCVQSTEEQAAFPRRWGVAPGRVVFTPFAHTLTPEELALPTSETGGVFAGGDSLRDYGPLLEIAPTLGAEVTIATRLLGPRWAGRLPSSVRVVQLDRRGLYDELRRARVVVVPFRAGIERAAGQFMYLNAMAFGKPVVVTDGPGVRDFVEPGVTGLIVPPGDPAALDQALRRMLAPEQQPATRALAARARETARDRFGPERYGQTLLDLVTRAAVRARPARAPAAVAARET